MIAYILRVQTFTTPPETVWWLFSDEHLVRGGTGHTFEQVRKTFEEQFGNIKKLVRFAGVMDTSAAQTTVGTQRLLNRVRS